MKIFCEGADMKKKPDIHSTVDDIDGTRWIMRSHWDHQFLNRKWK